MCAAALLPAIILPSQLAAQQTPADFSLRVGLLTAPTSSPTKSSERGVQLGVAEAKQTAQLFGGDVQLFEAPLGDNPAQTAAKLVSTNRVQVLVVSERTASDAISRFAEQRGLIFLNIATRDRSLHAACRRHTFHVEASEAMYRNAAQLSQRSAKNSAVTGDSAVLWWPTLERYGAGQINDRYRRRYSAGMDGSAWAGWAAIKLISESVLRARSTQPSKLIAYLESPTTTFDGHKGWPLTFRLADHQLRQPLYVVTHDQPNGGAQPHDVPDLRATATSRGSEGSSSTNRALDVLIGSPAAPHCAWSTSR